MHTVGVGSTSLPETRYARSGDVNVAYQVHGIGPPDLVVVPGSLSHLEVELEHPDYARFFARLGSFARVIRFDKRGTGMSDRVADAALPTMEERMDDVRAVMDAVGSERATVVGISEGGALAALFAASHPDRIAWLVLYGAEAWDPPPSPERFEAAFARIWDSWGTEADARRSLARFAPSVADDPAWIRWEARVSRLSASPGAVIALGRMNANIDIRPVLGAIHVPTLVLHRIGDRVLGTGAAPRGQHPGRPPRGVAG